MQPPARPVTSEIPPNARVMARPSKLYNNNINMNYNKHK